MRAAAGPPNLLAFDLSTLCNYVEGEGGKLSLIVEFPDRPPVSLAGFGEQETPARAKRRAKMMAKSGAKTGRAA